VKPTTREAPEARDATRESNPEYRRRRLQFGGILYR
jgi:hypothetical protein